MNQTGFLLAGVRNNCRRGSTHRLLFLDFDGVVNVPYPAGSEEYRRALAGELDDFFRPEMVQKVSALCLDYGLSIVITSSWRYEGMEYCLDHLYRAGLDRAVPVEGMTDTEDPLFRREGEISRYLKRAGDVGAFLILDDIPMDCFKGYEVCTDFEVGYDEACDRRARELLEQMIHPGHSVILRALDTILEWTGTFLVPSEEEKPR